MKAQWISLLGLAFFSLSATAVPHASLNQLTQPSDPNCSQAGSGGGLGDLIHQVNLIARKNAKGEVVDGRGLLSKEGPELGLTDTMISQIKKTVGDVFCPSIDDASHGTGFLIGEGGQILTNAHVFLNDTGTDRSRLTDCFWQNKETPYQRIPLDISANTYKPFTRAVKSEYYKDLAVVRLKRKVPGARPFRIDLSPLREGDEILMVSARQLKMPSLAVKTEMISTGPGRAAPFEYAAEPVIEACHVMTVSTVFDVVPTNGIFNDCSSTQGTSGSPVFALQNGELVVKAVNSVGGREAADGTPFTLERGAAKGMSFSYAIEINRDVADQLEAFEAGNEKKRTASEDSSLSRPNSNRHGI